MSTNYISRRGVIRAIVAQTEYAERSFRNKRFIIVVILGFGVPILNVLVDFFAGVVLLMLSLKILFAMNKDS